MSICAPNPESKTSQDAMNVHWRPIHYLGSKLRITNQIKRALDEIDPSRGRVCDLFAGSGAVASALASNRDVLAADIQEYSRILCSATLRPASFSSAQAIEYVSGVKTSDTFERFLWAIDLISIEEDRCLDVAQAGELTPVCDLLDATPLAINARANHKLNQIISDTQHRLSTLSGEGLDTVTVRNFGGLYFSYRQSAQIAALLIAARKQAPGLRETLTAATLSTVSEVANTVGKQFAQPLQLKDKAGIPKSHLAKKIVADRQLDVFEVYLTWLQRYLNLPRSERSHRAIRADFSETLQHHCENVSIIYADPPYTRDHYSRYYHVLETMCLGDDPEISRGKIDGKIKPLRGIYRADRHQSPFCIKSQAPKAFEQLFAKTRDLGVPLILSYSPLPTSNKPRPRVMTIEDIKVSASKYFKDLEQIDVNHITHNKLNNTFWNSEVSPNAELLLVCR